MTGGYLAVVYNEQPFDPTPPTAANTIVNGGFESGKPAQGAQFQQVNSNTTLTGGGWTTITATMCEQASANQVVSAYFGTGAVATPIYIDDVSATVVPDTRPFTPGVPATSGCSPIPPVGGGGTGGGVTELPGAHRFQNGVPTLIESAVDLRCVKVDQFLQAVLTTVRSDCVFVFPKQISDAWILSFDDSLDLRCLGFRPGVSFLEVVDCFGSDGAGPLNRNAVFFDEAASPDPVFRLKPARDATTCLVASTGVLQSIPCSSAVDQLWYDSGKPINNYKLPAGWRFGGGKTPWWVSLIISTRGRIQVCDGAGGLICRPSYDYQIYNKGYVASYGMFINTSAVLNGIEPRLLLITCLQEGGYYWSGLSSLVDYAGRGSHGPCSMQVSTAKALEPALESKTDQQIIDYLNNAQNGIELAAKLLRRLSTGTGPDALSSNSEDRNFKAYICYSISTHFCRSLIASGWNKANATTVLQERSEYFQYWLSVTK